MMMPLLTLEIYCKSQLHKMGTIPQNMPQTSISILSPTKSMVEEQPMVTKDKQWWTFKVLRLLTTCNGYVTLVTQTRNMVACMRMCQWLYREINLNLTTLLVKLTAKYCISFDFRPAAMEFSTRHLALCNHIYLSGCSQCEQVGTGQNWFLMHVK